MMVFNNTIYKTNANQFKKQGLKNVIKKKKKTSQVDY